jgi:hypothetical protein
MNFLGKLLRDRQDSKSRWRKPGEGKKLFAFCPFGRTKSDIADTYVEVKTLRRSVDPAKPLRENERRHPGQRQTLAAVRRYGSQNDRPDRELPRPEDPPTISGLSPSMVGYPNLTQATTGLCPLSFARSSHT